MPSLTRNLRHPILIYLPTLMTQLSIPRYKKVGGANLFKALRAIPLLLLLVCVVSSCSKDDEGAEYTIVDLLRRICNPTALNIWICNPLFSRITNAYIHCGRISNPPEQTLTFDF